MNLVSIFLFVAGDCRVRSLDMLPANAYRLLGHIAGELPRLRLSGPVDVLARTKYADEKHPRWMSLLHVESSDEYASNRREATA